MYIHIRITTAMQTSFKINTVTLTINVVLSFTLNFQVWQNHSSIQEQRKENTTTTNATTYVATKAIIL